MKSSPPRTSALPSAWVPNAAMVPPATATTAPNRTASPSWARKTTRATNAATIGAVAATIAADTGPACLTPRDRHTVRDRDSRGTENERRPPGNASQRSPPRLKRVGRHQEEGRREQPAGGDEVGVPALEQGVGDQEGGWPTPRFRAPAMKFPATFCCAETCSGAVIPQCLEVVSATPDSVPMRPCDRRRRTRASIHGSRRSLRLLTHGTGASRGIEENPLAAHSATRSLQPSCRKMPGKRSGVTGRAIRSLLHQAGDAFGVLGNASLEFVRPDGSCGRRAAPCFARISTRPHRASTRSWVRAQPCS